MRVYALNGTNVPAGWDDVADAFARERHDRTAFRRFVGQRREIRNALGIRVIDAGAGKISTA